MLKLLIVASISITSSFKVDRHAVAIKPVRRSADDASKAVLALRGGGCDTTKIAKYVVYFVSGFMFLPAGRDVVAPGTAIMPDDDIMLAKMFDDKSKAGYTFMWNAWGLNWIMLSVMKILAVSSGTADFVKLGFVADALALVLMFKGFIPEFKPFLAMFGLETLALAKLAFA